ncbi:hypothetical protein L3X38_033995 [Prunus dulcis]|uniref:Uncharacterized protein n=1 Tax=Prunus dulcis TaxID=3755 RepID=A0AAD4YWF3_PRUDU|nr:hypothetical protein L3X38_033995 [Prunus dulcis]
MEVAPPTPSLILNNHSRVEFPGGSAPTDADFDLKSDLESGSYFDDLDLDSDDDPDPETVSNSYLDPDFDFDPNSGSDPDPDSY